MTIANDVFSKKHATKTKSFDIMKIIENLSNIANTTNNVEHIQQHINVVCNSMKRTVLKFPKIISELITNAIISEDQITIPGLNRLYIHDCNAQIAKSLLLYGNINNRHITEKSMLSYMSAMKNKRWVPETSPIRIASDSIGGYIMDGHHRLTALSKCDENVVIDLYFEYNQSKEVEMTIDSGIKRNMYNSLQIAGASVPSTVGRMLINLDKYERNERMGSVGRYSKNSQILSGPDLFVYYRDKHPTIDQFIINWSNLPSHIISTANYILSNINQPLAEYFFDKLFNKTNMGYYHPIMILSRRLESLRNIKKQRKYYESDVFDLIFRTWNALVRLEHNKQLRINENEIGNVRPISGQEFENFAINISAIINNDMYDNSIVFWNQDK